MFENRLLYKSDLVTYLNERSIGTRFVFGGNLTKQPLFQTLPEGSYRISANLEYTDKIMNQGLFLGVYPGLSIEQLEYTTTNIKNFVNSCNEQTD